MCVTYIGFVLWRGVNMRYLYRFCALARCKYALPI